MKTIRSRDNHYVRHLIGLAHSSRERKKSGHTVLDGAHLVDAFLSSGRLPLSVAIRESAAESADALAVMQRVAKLQSADIEINILADALMNEASGLDSPAAIMAIVETPVSQLIPANADAVVVLDNVQDPGNVGSILRTAAAFGVKHALFGHGTAFAWSPKVLRAAQGAHFVVNIVEGGDVNAFVSTFGGMSLALVPKQDDVQSIASVDLTKPVAFLIGSEGAGLEAAVVAAATHRVTIPMSGKMESLNAAVCAAIAMYEMKRQRR